MGLDWGVCCAVGSFFVLFSPVTVTEVWVGRGSVLRARARASKQDGCTAKRIPPGSGDGEENLSPERLASSSATASREELPKTGNQDANQRAARLPAVSSHTIHTAWRSRRPRSPLYLYIQLCLCQNAKSAARSLSAEIPLPPSLPPSVSLPLRR